MGQEHSVHRSLELPVVNLPGPSPLFSVQSVSPDAVASVSESELQGLRVVDLRQRLRDRSLPSSGRKAELVDRLLHADASQQDTGSSLLDPLADHAPLIPRFSDADLPPTAPVASTSTDMASSSSVSPTDQVLPPAHVLRRRRTDDFSTVDVDSEPDWGLGGFFQDSTSSVLPVDKAALTPSLVQASASSTVEYPASSSDQPTPPTISRPPLSSDPKVIQYFDQQPPSDSSSLYVGGSSTPVSESIAVPALDLQRWFQRAEDKASVDFKVRVEIESKEHRESPQAGECISTIGSVDDGCMEVVPGLSFYTEHASRLGTLEPTALVAQVANARFQPFEGSLWLYLSVAGVQVLCKALVMSGPFNLLLGRTWLHASGAVHFYSLDWLYLQHRDTGEFVPVHHPEYPEDGPFLDPLSALESMQSYFQSQVTEPTTVLSGRTVVPVAKVSALAMNPDWHKVGLLEPWAEAGDAEWFDSFPAPAVSSVNKIYDLHDVEVTGRLSPERIARRALWQPFYPFRPPDCTEERAQKVLSLVKIGDASGSNLSPAQTQQVQELVTRFQHVFGLSPADLASNKLVSFDIDVDPDVSPYRSARVPPMTDADRIWLMDYCKGMLDAGVMRHVDPRDVTWCSDLRLVPKGKGYYTGIDMDQIRRVANEGLKAAGLPFDPNLPEPDHSATWNPPSGRRLVHNYVPLNRATRHVCSFPSRSMAQKVGDLAGHHFYSSLDMMSGYFALQATERAQQCLMFFVDGIGYLTYTRMPFGPSEGPTRYNLFGGKAFGHLEASNSADIGGKIVRWFDDLNAGSDNFEDHLRLLTTLFEICEDTGAVLSPGKTTLFGDRVLWCGNIIDRDGVGSDPAKVATIVLWKTPRTPMDVVRFINSAGFFRQQIPNFAAIAGPLHDLTAVPELPNGVVRKKGVRRRAMRTQGTNWTWGLKEERSFQLVKAAVAFAISTAVPDFDRPWHLWSDASPFAVSSVLGQIDDQHKFRVIAAASKKLNKAEMGMTQFLREFVAIRLGLDKFAQYLCSGPIVVTTDCIGLRDLLNSTELKETYIRWRESLMNWNIIQFVHRPGPQNLLCDGLSRRDHEGEDDTPIPETWIEREQWIDGALTDPIPTQLVTRQPHSVNDDTSRAAVDILR